METLSGNFDNHSHLKVGDKIEVLGFLPSAQSDVADSYPPVGSVVELVPGGWHRITVQGPMGLATGWSLVYRKVGSGVRGKGLVGFLREKGL